MEINPIVSGETVESIFMELKSNIVAVIHARMGSTRLPGKVLMPILDKPMLWHLVNRLEQVPDISKIIIATSNKIQDIEIKEFCRKHNFPVFCGDEHDVLDRFFQTVKETNATEVIRVTGDCPLIDPGIVSELIHLFQSQQLDFCGVATGAGVAAEQGINRYPDGLDTEIMKYEVLEQAWSEATQQFEREHVTPFIWKQPTRYNIGTLYAKDNDYSDYRWTVDNQEDYDLICWIYGKLYPANSNFGLVDIIKLLNRFPDMREKNRKYLGQEGYEQFKA